MWDVSQAEDVGSSVLPAGSYNVVVEKAELKTTKSGTGEYINVQFNVLDEKYKGRKIFNMFNIKNANPEAVKIGKSQLKSFATSAGLDPAKLSIDALLDASVSVKVKVVSDSFGDKNTVTAYSKSTLNALPKTAVQASDIPF